MNTSTKKEFEVFDHFHIAVSSKQNNWPRLTDEYGQIVPQWYPIGFDWTKSTLIHQVL